MTPLVSALYSPSNYIIVGLLLNEGADPNQLKWHIDEVAESKAPSFMEPREPFTYNRSDHNFLDKLKDLRPINKRMVDAALAEPKNKREGSIVRLLSRVARSSTEIDKEDMLLLEYLLEYSDYFALELTEEAYFVGVQPAFKSQMSDAGLENMPPPYGPIAKPTEEKELEKWNEQRKLFLEKATLLAKALTKNEDAQEFLNTWPMPTNPTSIFALDSVLLDLELVKILIDVGGLAPDIAYKAAKDALKPLIKEESEARIKAILEVIVFLGPKVVAKAEVETAAAVQSKDETKARHVAPKKSKSKSKSKSESKGL